MTDKARAKAGPSKVKKRSSAPVTYWLTRERGSDVVDVWLARPAGPSREPGAPCWELPEGAPRQVRVGTSDGEAVRGAKFARWTIEQCARACGTYPDDERQCLRVGPASGAAPPVAAS